MARQVPGHRTPRGPGHYAEDGCWWWDDGQGRWFRATDHEDVLAVEAEDAGGISLAASLLTTLSSQYGNGYFRFVAPAPMRTVVSGSSGCTSLAVYSPNASPLSRTRTCWPTVRPIVASRAASTEQCSRRSCRSRW